MYLFLLLIFSNGVKRNVVEYDKLGFQPEIICNVKDFSKKCIYFTNNLHLIECYKFIFKPEIISYVMWSTFANKVLTLTPDFLKLCQRTCCQLT